MKILRVAEPVDLAELSVMELSEKVQVTLKKADIKYFVPTGLIQSPRIAEGDRGFTNRSCIANLRATFYAEP